MHLLNYSRVCALLRPLHMVEKRLCPCACYVPHSNAGVAVVVARVRTTAYLITQNSTLPHHIQHCCPADHELKYDNVGGGPCRIDRRPSGLVSRRPFAPTA